MRILHLTLKKKWFDMITSGEKKEEYRELKAYWAKRLTDGIEQYWTSFISSGVGYHVKWKQFDAVRFQHGYAKNAPNITFKIDGLTIDKGRTKWGAEPRKEYFVIKLGDIISASGK